MERAELETEGPGVTIETRDFTLKPRRYWLDSGNPGTVLDLISGQSA